MASKRPRGPSRYNVTQSVERLRKEAFTLIDQSPANESAKVLAREAVRVTLLGQIPDLYPVKTDQAFQEAFNTRWFEAKQLLDYDHDSWVRVAVDMGLF